MSTTSTGGAYEVGQRGYHPGDLPHRFRSDKTDLRKLPRRLAQIRFGDDVPNHRLAYAAHVYVGETEKEAHEGAEKLLWYDTAPTGRAAIRQSPGLCARGRQRGHAARREHPLSAFAKGASVEAAIRGGFMFAGTPEQVYQQFKRHYEYVGGYGHLLNMGQAGFLEHDETVKGIRMFAREVYPESRRIPGDANLRAVRRRAR